MDRVRGRPQNVITRVTSKITDHPNKYRDEKGRNISRVTETWHRDPKLSAVCLYTKQSLTKLKEKSVGGNFYELLLVSEQMGKKQKSAECVDLQNGTHPDPADVFIL